jgi:N-acetyl-anhydromuramoyl-L-alanine amidase
MKINQNGLLEEVAEGEGLPSVSFVPSPNCDERPNNTEIDLLVIHNISLPPGEFGNSYIQDFFTNVLDIKAHPFFNEIATLEVSCHCFIRRDGNIIQFVPFTLRAWHAGQSEFEGREACNDFSIGIELEGTDELAYTEAQYDSLFKVTKTIQQHYPKITSNRIVGHSTIAPSRKTDPGPAFDWTRFKVALLREV